MTRTPSFIPCLSCLVILTALFGVAVCAPSVIGQVTAADDPPPVTEETVAKKKGPDRVIVRENRRRSVHGVVEYQDDSIIVVRTPTNTVESFLKNRVVQIVRLVEPQREQTGIVYLRQGNPRRGVILRDEYDYVLMEVNGITQKLVREVVDHVVLEPTFDEQYRRFKASIGPGMYDKHMALAQWLFRERKYELARTEINALIQQAPDTAGAARLRTVIDAQIALALDRTDPATGEPNSKPPKVRPVDDDLIPAKLISNEDVNLIQVFEIDFNQPPRVTIPPETIKAFVESYGTHPSMPDNREGRRQLFRVDPINVVRLMFETRAREFYPQIEVNSEPYSLHRFRTWVHDAWLINTCATTRCHGGTNAGRFFLHRRDFRHRRVRYTNLLILERIQIDPTYPMVDYDNPRRSLLIQYGLPRADAERPHPPAKGWKPVFRPNSPRMLNRALDWIGSMMMPRPGYPVQYDPPLVGVVPEGEDAGDLPETDRIDR